MHDSDGDTDSEDSDGGGAGGVLWSVRLRPFIKM